MAGSPPSSHAAGSPTGDPRFHLAAQRTLLAWLRTAIAVMAFGFVIARLPILLELIRPGESDAARRLGALALGLGLVGLGVLAAAVGAIQYQRFCRSLPPEDASEPRLVAVTLAIAWALAVAGLVLAAALAI